MEGEKKISKITIYKLPSKLYRDGKYHGCWGIYEDGTRKLITKGCKCKFPTDDLFWKEAKDVDFKIKTRAKKAKLENAKMKEALKYFCKEVDKTEKTLFEMRPDHNNVYYMTVAWN